ncbi:MAG: EAL domain-containing protein [Betaproteobacteria bacterium]|nr:EAL domain-containing protein [Betaproteobacteria bacterium]
MQAAVSARFQLESDLRSALGSDSLYLEFQTQFDRAVRVCGAEALARWMHPQRGGVSPVEFIPVAETSSLILSLGKKILQSACEQLQEWSTRPELSELVLAVNVSARQFRDPEFVPVVLDVLSRTGADPQRLKLELTESMLIDEVDSVIAKMTALKAHGVGFSLDDFGTGYSSLAYLKRLPLDQLKIDQSFVRDVLTDPNDAAISRMVIVLAETLGLSVIAEGVETQAQRDALAALGCPAFQGNYFSRPVRSEAFTALVLSKRGEVDGLLSK